MLTAKGCELAKCSPATLRRVKHYIDTKEALKATMEAQDALLDQLIQELGAGKAVMVGKARVAMIVDQFDGKNLVFRAHAVRRFELTCVGTKEEGE